MLIRGHSSIEQIAKISVFLDLETAQLEYLVPHSCIRDYQRNEIIVHEGDRLPPQLHALSTGILQIKKTATNGKETLVRLIPPGEIFAAPAIFGDGISPATVIAQVDSQVLTVEKEALLEVIRHHPEIALRILSVFNQRLQQLHNTVHGLISERAIVRLVRVIQYYAHRDGTHTTVQGDCLNINLPYYQIARSIGITYEECVRLFKKINQVVTYQRGGKIIVKNWQQLEKITYSK
ncbi:Crp/Fnr family transcriptional regulator [Mastigocoleus testarum]|uniref:Cyclic nucleotide-binding protein n=1 Tax=Mastigocoleus testarum BC008 TaxID=371196 RepID=A0A0V7ZP36_9CYAN|nr:Crp/Fnr family transcriptional regulator [Mastigocoleus testarum]KST66355.1 cyclic nucleotide-binding protein [Mastigocoleus testarum BC008]KST66676.1 cyclic nucleotide-binding protein [Mastigocoleus testarum BC008]